VGKKPEGVLQADVGYYETELAATRRCLQSVAVR
jgi:hypothetical protein